MLEEHYLLSTCRGEGVWGVGSVQSILTAVLMITCVIGAVVPLCCYAVTRGSNCCVMHSFRKY